MEPKNVFDALKPIIFALKFFGLSFGKKSTQMRNSIKNVQKFSLTCAYCLLLSFGPLLVVSESQYFGRGYSLCSKMIGIAVGISCVNRWLFLRESRLKKLTAWLKHLPLLREGSRKAVSTCLRPIYVFTAMNIYCFGIGLLSISFTLVYHINPAFVIFAVWFISNGAMIVFFPVFLSYLTCVIPVYCVARVTELGQDVSRAHSRLRRARLVTTLFGQYRRLKRLATMTDRSMADVMSAVHLLFVLESALYVLLHEEICHIFPFLSTFGSLALMVTSSFPVIVYFYPFLQFKLIASSANRMCSQISRALIDSMLIDDEGLSRDPATRPLLLKIRLTQLFDLSHIVLEDASFTCFGQPIEDDALFTLFMEAFDMYNTISTANNKETALTRIRLDWFGKLPR